MKYILIIGASNSGKSETINAVCEKLKPTKIWVLVPNKEDKLNSNFKLVSNSTKIINGSYLVEINGKIIFVCAGSPTEQKITITVLISICVRLKITIDFALISMRAFERKIGFKTINELKSFGEPIFKTKIFKIQQDNFQDTEEWNNRIENIVKLTKENL